MESAVAVEQRNSRTLEYGTELNVAHLNLFIGLEKTEKTSWLVN